MFRIITYVVILITIILSTLLGVLPEHTKDTTRIYWGVLLEYTRGTTRTYWGYYPNILGVLPEYTRGTTRIYWGYYQNILGVLPEHTGGTTRTYYGYYLVRYVHVIVCASTITYYIT